MLLGLDKMHRIVYNFQLPIILVILLLLGYYSFFKRDDDVFLNRLNNLELLTHRLKARVRSLSNKVDLNMLLRENRTMTGFLQKSLHDFDANDLDRKKELLTLSHVVFDSVVREPRAMFDLMILISSHARNSWRREWIRNLWAKKGIWKNSSWRIVFITGYEKDEKVMQNLKIEAHHYQDIVIEKIVEDFYEMAKKVIIGLTWAKENFSFRNILKADDDVFVNIDNAMKFVADRHGEDGYYGNVITDGLVERQGRYGVSRKEHLGDVYNPYCSGGGFILTNISVHEILPFFDFNRVLKIDDAHVGETAFKAGIEAQNVNGFYMSNNWCEYREDMLVSHPVKEYKCMKFLMMKAIKAKGNWNKPF